MILKEHKTPDGRLVVALCDDDLLGKKFEEGKLCLDLSGDFYKGEEKEENEVLDSLKDACAINAVGKKAVDFLIKNNFVDKEKVIYVLGIPHAQCVLG